MTKLSPKEFLKRYANDAVREMSNSGVPASITLAQAALESGWAGSELASKHLNFFGIKTHRAATGYEGGGVNMDTTEYKGGKRITIVSEFRKYETAEDSFADHSQFLIDNKRYKSLFDLDPLDYKGWARGLQDAKYATDPK